MKIILTCLLTLFLGYCHAQYSDAPYRLYGEISTVENQTYRGFISWGATKNYWIDFFEASKIKNPYTTYFYDGDGILFYSNGQRFAKPPVHIFCCRFGNLKSIRPTGDKEAIVQLKNGDELTLIKGNFPDISNNVQITTSSENVSLKWDHISEVRFMSADKDAISPVNNQVAGIVKSSQGIYKGLIYWNYNKRQTPEKINSINILLNKMDQVTQMKGTRGNHIFELLAKERNSKKLMFANSNALLSPMDNVTINMPNIGSVSVPCPQFNELNVIPISELNLLTYNDFEAVEPIQGEIITRTQGQVSGQLAYDLDENLNIEVLDGKNNSITYRIPFKYISTIEPKNYKYSFITLKNGSKLSLGEAPDVNRENSGIIISDNEKIPYYIPWEEVKKITLK